MEENRTTKIERMAGDGSSSETSQSNSADEPFVENPEETMGVTAGTDERAGTSQRSLLG